MPGCLFSMPPVLGRRLDLVAPAPLWRHVERLHGLIRPLRLRAHPSGFVPRSRNSVQNTSGPSAFFNAEGREGRWREADDSLPQTMQPQKELDLIPPDHDPCGLHLAPAAGADHGILAPDLPNEIAPERTQGAGAFRLGRGKNEERCRAGFWRFRFRCLPHRRARLARAGVHASALV